MKKATAAPSSVEQLLVSRLRPNPWNRKRFDETKLKEFAASITKAGILHPILVRPHPDPDPGVEQWEIVAGERRWRAAQMAGLEVVPATVRKLSDVQVVEALAIENTHREDVDPLEEGREYQFLLEHGDGYDVRVIAERIAKSVSYVYQRVKLLTLIPEAMVALEGSTITAGHAILIARLQPDDQKAALTKALDPGYGYGPGGIPVRELADWIHEEIHLALKGAPFPMKDAELLPEAGPCTTCAKRSGCAPDLFPDIQDKDVCMDRACFRAKADAQYQQRLAKAEAKHGKGLLRVDSTWGRRRKGVVAKNDYAVVTKGTKGAQPAIVAVGTDRGKLVHVKVTKPQQEAAKKRQQRTEQRQERAGEERQALTKQIEQLIGERAEHYAARVEEIAATEIQLDNDVALFLASSFDRGYEDWPGRKGAGRAESEEELEHAIVQHLPGEWSERRALGFARSKDGIAARCDLALQIWLAREAAAIEKILEAAAKSRLQAVKAEAASKATKLASKPKAKAKKKTARK